MQSRSLAAAKQGSLLKAPDMYMEKLVVGPEAKGAIDLDKSLEDIKKHSESTLINIKDPDDTLFLTNQDIKKLGADKN